MTAAALDELLATLAASGVRLSAEGDHLRCDAPRGILTPELQASLRASKDEILARLTRESAAIPRCDRSAAGLPLSPAQYRLWLLDRLEGGTPRYNLLSAVRLAGVLNDDALECAFQALIERHEILRSRFVSVKDAVVQIPLDHCAVEVIREDHSRLPGDEDAAIRRAFGAESQFVFDLGNPPLVRARLLRFAPDRHALILNMHHIVTDVWSLEIFARDFACFYAAHAGLAAPVPAPLPIQYADYAAWQQERSGGEQLQRGLAYWTHRLRGLPERLPLPTDFTRPATLTYRGGAVPVHLAAPLVTALRRAGREAGASLFMVLFTALCILLSRLCGSRDLAIGAPATDRPRPELEGLIGFFINSLVLRCSIEPGATFRDLLTHNRDTVLAAFEHQDVPFEKLVEALNVRRDLSYAPIFQVMLSFMNRTPPPGEILAAEPLAIPQQHALFELDWQLRETGDGVTGFLIYAADLFAPETAELLVSRLVRVLEQVCAEPGRSVASIDLLAPDERRTMLETWNATAAEYPAERGVHELVAEQARRTPDALAVTCAGSSWTYRQLEAESNRMAAALRGLGAGPGALVGVCLMRDQHTIAALLAIIKTGAAYVPLDPGFPAERLAFMATDAQLLLTLSDPRVDAGLRARLGAVAPVLFLDDLATTPEHSPRGTAPAGPDATMYTIYTSGSTGRPKGVVITHRSVVNFLWSMRREPGITSTDALLAVTTLSFDIAVLELFLPLVSGARLVLASREDTLDAQRLIRLIETESITLMQATPATWRMLLAAGWAGTPGLTMLCGGEALPRELSRPLLARGRALWNMYGPTETTVWSAVHRVEAEADDARGAVEPIGRPIANTRLYILTPELDVAPCGAAGELCIGGAGLAREYLNQPALTSERFVRDPFANDPDAYLYRTGDSARFRSDGTIEFLGRLDGQVKLRGFRIEPAEIESVLARHPAVAQCAVALGEGASGDPQLIAYYVSLETGAGPPAAELRDHLRSALPEYMVPAAFVRLERIPLTPNGKLDRHSLPSFEAKPGYETETSADEPGNVESAIAALWEEVLGTRPPRLDANFFDLGGHSLLVLRLHQRLVDGLGATCEALDLFRYPTIRGQAALIAGAQPRRDVRADARVHAKRQQQALARRRR